MGVKSVTGRDVKPRFNLELVDGSDPNTSDCLERLHKACYDASEVQPDYEVGFWWIASERLSGAYTAFGGLTLWNDTTGFLERVGVLPKYRGHRLQQRLIRVRLRKAKALGLERVITYTHPEAVQSSNNLIKTGFQLYDPPMQFPGHWLYWQRWV